VTHGRDVAVQALRAILLARRIRIKRPKHSEQNPRTVLACPCR